ncbi:hypothetical protein NKG94_34315 [Micromonospora sp. M12]
MRTPPVIARAALLCGLAGAAWCALATLNPDTARADDRPATTTEQPQGLLGTVRDVVDQVLPTPRTAPSRTATSPSLRTRHPPPTTPAGKPTSRTRRPTPRPRPKRPIRNRRTPPASEPRDNPPPSRPVVQLPSIELPVDLPVVPPITVVTPPIVIEVPDPRPAAPTTDPAPSQLPAPIVVTLPIIGPTAQPAATQTPAAQVDTDTSTTDEAADGDTSPAVATGTDASDEVTELAPDGLPVPIGPVLGRTLDDGIRPSEPVQPVRVGECSRHERTLEEVRQALRDMIAKPDRGKAKAVDRTTRPCPGAPLGPDTDAATLAAVQSPGRPAPSSCTVTPLVH